MKSTPSFNLEKAAYPVREVPGGIIIDAPVSGGRLVGRKRADGTYRRQCGEFCNDSIGIPSYFGNKLSEKQKRITSPTPGVGSVAVLDTPGATYIDANGKLQKAGHVLIVERPYIRQDWHGIVETNFDGKESFRRIECSTADLQRRGLLGFTAGLDMTPALPPVAPEAARAWAKAKRKGIVSDTTNPEEEVISTTLQWVMHNSGVMQEPKGEKKQLQWYILALDRDGWFDRRPDKKS